MNSEEFEVCLDCGVVLSVVDGPRHRYFGASPSCWAMSANFLNGGEPALASAPLNVLLVDAYAAQHPGRENPQAIQSVAVHLLTLYGVLERGVAPERVHWIRRRAVRVGKGGRKHERYGWLTPPDLTGRITIGDIVGLATPQARAERVAEYVADVLDVWMQAYSATIASWYEKWVVGSG